GCKTRKTHEIYRASAGYAVAQGKLASRYRRIRAARAHRQERGGIAGREHHSARGACPHRWLALGAGRKRRLSAGHERRDEAVSVGDAQRLKQESDLLAAVRRAARQEQFLEVGTAGEAHRRFAQALDLQPKGTEEVALESALGRVLADDTLAPIDVPPF